MTIQIPRRIPRPAWTSGGLSRRRFLSTAGASGARRHRDALSQPRRRPAADDPRRAIRRRRRRWRRGVVARRPAVADDGRGRHHRIIQQCAGVATDRGVARKRLHRQDAAGKSSRRTGDFLSRPVPRPVAYRRRRASQVVRGASAPRRPTGAMSASSGAATSPDKAGASIPTMAAWSPSPPCIKHRPDFLLHSGDTIYADGIISRPK